MHARHISQRVRLCYTLFVTLASIPTPSLSFHSPVPPRTLIPKTRTSPTTIPHRRHPTSHSIPLRTNTRHILSLSPDVVTSSTITTAAGPASSLASPLASVAIIAFVILIHELGHFTAARSFGIRVQEFSVGVGPKIVGFRRKVSGGTVTKEVSTVKPTEEKVMRPWWQVSQKSKKTKEVEVIVEDEEYIDFNLRAIPFGGYVAFPENYNRTLLLMQEYERSQANAEMKKKEENGVVSKETKAAPLNFFSKFLAKNDTAIEPPLPPPPTKSFWQKKQKSAPATPIPATTIQYYNDPNLLQNRPWTQRAVVLVGGVVFNLLLAFALYFGELTVGPGLPRPVVEAGAVVRSVPRTDGAAYGVLNRGDVIVGVNGQQLSLARSNSMSSAQDTISSVISTIRSTPSGDSLTFSVKSSPDGTIRDVSIMPRASINPDGTLASPPTIGVTLTPNVLRTELIRPDNLPSAVITAATAVGTLTTETASAVTSLFISLLLGTGPPAGASLSGPVGVIRTGSDVIATAGDSGSALIAAAAFAAAISINLAVVNSLPFPGLDGGQLVFVLGEAVTGRKIDQKVQDRINAYALLFLALVSLTATVGDVGDLIRR